MLSKTELAKIAFKLETHGAEIGEDFYVNMAKALKTKINTSAVKMEGKKKKMVSQKYYSWGGKKGINVKSAAPKPKEVAEEIKEYAGKANTRYNVEAVTGSKKVAPNYYAWGTTPAVKVQGVTPKPQSLEDRFEQIVLGRPKRQYAIREKYYSTSDPTDTTINPTWAMKKKGRGGMYF